MDIISCTDTVTSSTVYKENRTTDDKNENKKNRMKQRYKQPHDLNTEQQLTVRYWPHKSRSY